MDAGAVLRLVPLRTGGAVQWWRDALHQPGARHESLDEATRREIDGLRLINYNPFIRLREGGYGGGFATYRTPDIEPIQGSEHPLVRTHPESGRRVLFLSAHTEVEIPGYDPARGQALIGRLREHLARPELSYSHAWSVGDIVWWDNQAVLHARNAFPASERRRLKRISLAGSRPFWSRHPQRAPVPPLPTGVGRCAPLWRAPSVPANSRTATCCRSSAISPRLSCP